MERPPISTAALAPPPATGERVIVAYKLAKAVVQATLGLTLIVAALCGFAHPLHALAVHLREHATAAWSVALAERLVSVATRHSLFIAAAALLLDSLASGFEGWALRRGYWWAAWLIVLATAALLPWEMLALVRRRSPWRVLLLFANLTIIVYLVYRRLAVRPR